MVAAAAAFKAPRGRGSIKGIFAHIMVEPELVPILDADGNRQSEYTIDSRRAVVQGNGIIRSRPKFEAWSADFDVLYDPDLITDEDIFKAVLTDAGNRIGIGDYRPQKTGWFGRFNVAEREQPRVSSRGKASRG
jgi:hypothetical protein